MKKYILIISLGLLFGFSSCDLETDEDPGGTNVEKMAGKWTVTFEQSVDEYNYIFDNGKNPNLDLKTPEGLDSLKWEDIYGTGKVAIYSYNTASNASNCMWFSDYAASSNDASFWTYKVKVDVNYAARKFSCAETVNLAPVEEGSEPCNVTIIGGKVLEGAATTPRGMAADSIVAYVKFSDDQYGFTYMKVSGYRYTGFTADN